MWCSGAAKSRAKLYRHKIVRRRDAALRRQFQLALLRLFVMLFEVRSIVNQAIVWTSQQFFFKFIGSALLLRRAALKLNPIGRFSNEPGSSSCKHVAFIHQTYSHQQANVGFVIQANDDDETDICFLITEKANEQCLRHCHQQLHRCRHHLVLPRHLCLQRRCDCLQKHHHEIPSHTKASAKIPSSSSEPPLPAPINQTLHQSSLTLAVAPSLYYS